MLNLKKRIIPTALAGVMALSMAVPAFASSSNTTKVTASYSEIPIDVIVPTAATVTINPMGMPVKLPAAEGSTAKEVATQIVTMPSAIINRSSMDLTVGATVTGTVKGNFKFAATAWDAEEDAALDTPLHTANDAFVILEMKKATTASMWDEDTKKLDADSLATEWEGWTEKTWTDLATADDVAAAVAGADGANDAILVLSTKAATTGKNGLAKLDAATVADDAVTVATGGVGLFRLSGLVSDHPKTAWAKADGFGATIAFTFKATKPAPAGG